MAQELELKVLVSAEEFYRCLALARAETGQGGDGYVQVNYYFDTPDFALAADHSMLRVRRKKNALYLQYKNKRRQVDGMLLCDEEEAPLSQMPRKVNPQAYFPNTPQAECILHGDLVTFRTDFSLPGCVISFDENTYWGVTDYEIEIEGEAQAIQSAAALLNPQGETKKGNGKFSRFLKRYRTYYYGEEEGETL